jgi:hypothetical protein
VPASQGTPKSSDILTYIGLATGVNLAAGESRDFFAQINIANDKVVWMELTHFELKKTIYILFNACSVLRICKPLTFRIM